jgi:hypothetical protein
MSAAQVCEALQRGSVMSHAGSHPFAPSVSHLICELKLQQTGFSLGQSSFEAHSMEYLGEGQSL